MEHKPQPAGQAVICARTVERSDRLLHAIERVFHPKHFLLTPPLNLATLGLSTLHMVAALPKVSILTAAYNRGNILKYAIASVLRSRFTDWEMLVIGDACTDETEQVVASFHDPRISFFNLPVNVGEQSGPNNEGMRRARGQYIAYLNQDDFFTPDHLTTAIAGIEETGADLVFTLGLAMSPNGGTHLLGFTETGRYEPHIYAPASLWLFRRELARAIGPWHFYRQCRGIPSQDWLFRAWRAQKDLRLIPRVTVITVPSAGRKGVYANRDCRENEHFYQRMTTEPEFLERQITIVALDSAARLNSLKLSPLVRGLFRNIVLRMALWFRVHPWALVDFMRFRRRGWFVDHAREFRGLPKLQ